MWVLAVVTEVNDLRFMGCLYKRVFGDHSYLR